MRKIIFTAAFLVVISAAFFFYNSRTTVIADDKDGKCCNTECPKYADCQKQCDKQCDKKCEDCTKQCEKKCDEEGQSQMNNNQKMDCQGKSGCDKKSNGMNKSGSCPMKKQQIEKTQ